MGLEKDRKGKGSHDVMMHGRVRGWYIACPWYRLG